MKCIQQTYSFICKVLDHTFLQSFRGHSFDKKGGVKTLNHKIHFNINLHRRYISEILYSFSSSQKNTPYA